MKNAKTVREENGELYVFVIDLFSAIYGEVDELVIMLTLLNNLVTYYDRAIWSELWRCRPPTGTQGTDVYRFYRHRYNYKKHLLLCTIIS